MQKYPYLERNTQKLKNHTRKKLAYSAKDHTCHGLRFNPFPFQLPIFYVLAQLICKKTCTQVKAHKHSLDFLLQDCLYAVTRRQKHNTGHTVSGSFGQCCFVELS